MKKTILIAALMLLGVIAFAQTKQIHVKVDGLACPICTYGLEKKLKKIDGAENVKVDLQTSLATFNMKEGKTITEEEIKKRVKNAGYTVREIKYVDLPKEQKK